jgi:hypothetical protein
VSGALPRWVDVRTDGVSTRHFLDYDRLEISTATTVEAYCTMCVRAVLELEAALVERAILDGHDRFEVQIDGGRTTLHTIPTWRRPRQRLRVWWARWRHRHPQVGTELLEAMAWSGTVWSAAPAPPRMPR